VTPITTSLVKMVGTDVGPYRILALLGRGAIGEVYLAYDKRLRRKVALKLQPRASTADPSRRKHLEREARALGALNHPGIVGVHGIEQYGDLLFLVTEFVDGTPLGTLIATSGMPFDEIVRIGAELADAIGAAHRHGIIHRDLKPSNVMVTAEGAVKVLDFGLAKIQHTGVFEGGTLPDGSGSATVAGTIAGTAHYMSPEQAQGLPIDARSDIFSLGVMLFQMATGRRPFEGETPLAVLSSIIKDTPPLVSVLRPELPPTFSRLVARCLEKEPGKRVQDALDVAAQLRDAGGEATVTSPQATLTQRERISWGGVRRHWTWALAVFVLAAGAAATTWLTRTPRPTATVEATRIAVAPFENRSKDASLDAVGLMVADRIGQGLSEQLALRIVPGPAVMEAWPEAPRNGSSENPPDRVGLLGRRVGAGVVVSGDYYTLAGELAFRARITDVRTGRDIAQFGPVTGPQGAPAEAVEKVRQYVVGEAAIHFKGVAGSATAGIPPSFAPGAPPMTYEVYRELTVGLHTFGRDPRATIAHLERVEQLYPHRALVLPWLVLSYMRLGEFDKAQKYVDTVRARMSSEDMSLVDYFSARLDGRWVDAYRAIRAFHRLLPEHLPTVNTTAGAALALGRPKEALALLSSVDVTPWLESPSGRTSLSMRAEAEHMLGEYEQELQIATRLGTSAPESGTALIRSLAALGRADQIPEAIERMQIATPRTSSIPTAQLLKQAAEELRAHGHVDLARTMARQALELLSALDAPVARTVQMRQLRGEVLVLLERWRESSRVFAQLASEKPGNPSVLSGLGVALARLGDRAAANEASNRLAQLQRPYLYGAHTYGRARIAAALGQSDRAIELLQQAFAEGQVIIWQAHVDPAFETLRHHPPFERLTAMNQEPKSTGSQVPVHR
jgi:tRNA A-37 threonylcarbamoyl transferase component Bud32/tetratricopeptide (TPR) repeat protein